MSSNIYKGIQERAEKDLLLIVALKAEAMPFIDKYKLKRSKTPTAQLYESNKVSLLISGVGPVKTEQSTKLAIKESDYLVICNVGICGAANNTRELGSIVIANHVYDYNSGASYFPDLLTQHDFIESTLISSDSPILQPPFGQGFEDGFFDMEASSICKTIKSKSPPHNCHFIKIISDYLEGTLITSKDIHSMMSKRCSEVSSYIDRAIFVASDLASFSQSAKIKLHAFCKSIHLTKTELIKLTRLLLLQCTKPDPELNILDKYIAAGCSNKHQKKIILENIYREVLS